MMSGFGFGFGLGALTPRKGGGTSVAPLSLHRAEVATALTLPSPYSGVGPDMVHPSVIYIPGGWSGYNRWMAVTPYPTSNDDYENPCILASNDGDTWVAPPGLTNPVVGPPADVAGGGFNSDPHLVLSPDRSKLYLLYRYFTAGSEPKERLRLLESSDGVTWSAPQTIFSSDSTVRRLVAPSLWFDGAQWVILACDIVQAGNPFVRLANGGADPYSGWPSVPTNITLAHPLGGSWWHGFFIRQPNGTITGIIQDGTSAGGSLWLANSTDNGETFSVSDFDLTGGAYRSCFTVISASGDGQGEFYYGRVSPNFHVRRADATFNRPSVLAALPVFMANVANTFRDDFERADAASLGTPPTGQSYVVDTGSFGISSGRAYITTTANSRALLDLGSGGNNVRLMGRMETAGTQGYFIFRGTDANNYWRIGKGSGSILRLQKIVSGAVSIDRALSVGVVDASLFTKYMEVVASGSSITVLINGEPVWTESDSSTGTKVGLQGSGAAATYWSEFTATKL